MSPISGLASTDLCRLLKLAFVDEAPETAAAQHVGALAHNGGSELIVHQQCVDAGNTGFGGFNSLARWLPGSSFAKQVDVAVDGAAAAADKVDPTRIHESPQRRRHGLGGLVVLSVLVRHSGVWHAGYWKAGNGRQSADVVGHECRTGGAVDSDPQQVAVLQRDI